jgi:cobalt-zinc-cadmium efflux system protein
MHDGAHEHRGHNHTHDHHGHAHYSGSGGGGRYSIAIGLNLGFVAIEAAAGFWANSTALISDAAHNLSDVLGLVMAGAAAWLAQRKAGAQRTYGFSKATVLAALANALVLFGACGALLLEAGRRLFAPEEAAPLVVVAVASVGVLINGATALLFVSGSKSDVNARAAFLHMAADAGVSAAVIVAGVLMWMSGAAWIDPAVTVLVVAVIVVGTWGLLRESLDLALDAAPRGINVSEVRAVLAAQPGVTAVHDLHVWALSATTPALTAHLVRPDGNDDAFLASLTEQVRTRFGIAHITVQIERTQRDDCAEC